MTEEEKGKAEKEKARTEEEMKEISAEQAKSENKILKSFLLLAGVLLLGFIAFMIFIQGGFGDNPENFTPENFTFRGIDYQKVREGNLTFYRMSFPVNFRGGNYDYRIWTRKDPRELNGSVPLEGDFLFRETRNVVLKFDENLKCETRTIAEANFMNLRIFGTNVTRNDDASCQPDGDFLFINVRTANRTAIVQTGKSCYDFNVNDCEVLDVTERYMLEVFSFANGL